MHDHGFGFLVWTWIDFFSRLCGHRESGLLQRNHADVARPGRRGRTGDPSGTVVDWILHEELFYIVV